VTHGEDWSFPGCLKVQRQRDTEHAHHIAAWREAADLKGKTGLRELLLAALAAGVSQPRPALVVLRAGAMFPMGIDFCLNLRYNNHGNLSVAPQPSSQS